MSNNNSNNFLKSFSLFMKFYNQISTNGPINVEDALKNATILAVFYKTTQSIHASHGDLCVELSVTKQGSSTRSESLSKLNVHSLQGIVLDYIRKNPDQTRAEIGTALKMRHSSLTGRTSELLSQNSISVSGTVFDATTNRRVQTLRAVAGAQ